MNTPIQESATNRIASGAALMAMGFFGFSFLINYFDLYSHVLSYALEDLVSAGCTYSFLLLGLYGLGYTISGRWLGKLIFEIGFILLGLAYTAGFINNFIF